MHNNYLLAVTLLSAASSHALFLQTLIFRLQTKPRVFQDTFSVSLAWIKFEVLFCVYVLCSAHKIILNICTVLKASKK